MIAMNDEQLKEWEKNKSINPITKRKLLSGEMVVMTHNLEFIGKILIPYW